MSSIKYDTKSSDSFFSAGGETIVSYEKSDRGVDASLLDGVSYKIMRVMPFGDSITYGFIGPENTETGGYRKYLAQQLADDDVVVDFVGSLANGPTTFDRDHEGHLGWTIDELTAAAAGFVTAADPDTILLMAGTNDTKTDTSAQIIADLENLVLETRTAASDAAIIVASIPPMLAETKGEERAATAENFNDLLPGLIDELQSEGHPVAFADMRDLTDDDIAAPPVDSGLHPNAEGYAKIADHWWTALTAEAGLDGDGIGEERDRFAGITGLIGSAQTDILEGDGGTNVLVGGPGDDRLTGGADADLFVYAAGDGADVITDFAPAAGDRLEVTGHTAYDRLETTAAGTRMVFSATDNVLFENLDPAALADDAVLFDMLM